MVPENCRESLLIEKFCGWRKITFVLSQGRRVMGIGSLVGVVRVVGSGSRVTDTRESLSYQAYLMQVSI